MNLIMFPIQASCSDTGYLLVQTRICNFLKRGRKGKLLIADRRIYREPSYY